MEGDHSKEIGHTLKGTEIKIVDVDESDDLDKNSLSSEDTTTIPVTQVLDNSLGIEKPDCKQKVLMGLNPSINSEENRKGSPRREEVDIENQMTAALNEAESNEACASVNIDEPLTTVEDGKIAVEEDNFDTINKQMVNRRSEIIKKHDNLLRKVDEFGNLVKNELAKMLSCKLKIDLNSIASEQKQNESSEQNMEDDEKVSERVKQTVLKIYDVVTVADRIEKHFMDGDKVAAVQEIIFEPINRALEDHKSEITAKRDNVLRKIDERGNSVGNENVEILDNVDNDKTDTSEVIQGRTQDNSQIQQN